MRWQLPIVVEAWVSNLARNYHLKSKLKLFDGLPHGTFAEKFFFMFKFNGL